MPVRVISLSKDKPSPKKVQVVDVRPGKSATMHLVRNTGDGLYHHRPSGRKFINFGSTMQETR